MSDFADVMAFSLERGAHDPGRHAKRGTPHMLSIYHARLLFWRESDCI